MMAHSLRQFEVFLAVARAKSFRRAADGRGGSSTTQTSPRPSSIGSSGTVAISSCAACPTGPAT